MVTELVPYAPGIPNEPFLDAGAQTRHTLADYVDPEWPPPVPFGSQTIEGIEVTIDARVADNVAIMSLLLAPPEYDRALLERILHWQLDRRSVAIAINQEAQFFVTACWPRKLMNEDLFEVLIDHVVQAVPEAETVLFPA